MLGDGYRDWLSTVHEETSSNADIVAHFYRRGFDLVRQSGTLGLIATNTIAQGDTRASGLRWICKHGGKIFSVRRRVKWPGLAAVVVSVLHIGKGSVSDRKQIDGRDVDNITAFLFHRGGHDDPVRLPENAGRSFVGSYVLGMGFTFDETDTKGVASSLAEMGRLIEKDPRNRKAIFPYIGGEEVNSSPTHAHHRYVIDFRDYPLCRDALNPPEQIPMRDLAAANRPEGQGIGSWADATDDQRSKWLQRGRVPPDYPRPVAADWPDLLAIIARRVQPARASVKRPVHRLRWWQHADKRPALYRAIAGLKRVLVTPQTSNVQAFAFLSSAMVFSHTVIIFPFDTYASFAVLQSRTHQIWSAFLGPTMKDDLRYTPSDCCETFPFPDRWESDVSLETAGYAYYKFRASLMVHNDEGMTKIYNRFHDPTDDDPAVERLRELHAAMDRAVLGAYGWSDVSPRCDFVAVDGGDDTRGVNSTKRYRYAWPPELAADVLSRLLELNAGRTPGQISADRRMSRSGSLSKPAGIQSK